MYIAIYELFEQRQLKHIANISGISYDLTRRVYDFDTFTASGVCDEDINNGLIAILNDDYGNYIYACFIDSIKIDGNKTTIKGLDFRTIFDSEILLDYTSTGSFAPELYSIFYEVVDKVFRLEASRRIDYKFDITDSYGDNPKTYELLGDYDGQYIIVNAYKFLKAYLKYYEFNIETRFDIIDNYILFNFVRNTQVVEIDLTDFIHELTTTSQTTNMAIATIRFTPTEENTKRPEDIATCYYYRTLDNDIIQTYNEDYIADCIYPLKTKIFEREYLSEAQFEAVYELANSRYVDNIIIDNNLILDPIDLSEYPLYTKVQLFYKGKKYKILPISEKIETLDINGKNTKIKLGFKKILLTEVIKK